MVDCFHIHGFALAALLAGAANAAAQQVPVVEGCLGKDAHVCEQSFARVLREAEVEENLDQQLKKRTTIRLSGYALTIPGSFTLRAEVGPGNRITAALMILPFIPSTVPTTEIGYGKSGLYEALVILLGSSCVPARETLYRLFEEKIRPTLQATPDRSHGADTYFEKAESIPFCKHLLTYSTLYGTDPYHLTLKAPPGSFVFPAIAVQ
jgi:hypothetical protein